MQAKSKLIYDNCTLIPIHVTDRAYAQQKYVFDTGHMEMGMWTDWRPEDVWMEKH